MTRHQMTKLKKLRQEYQMARKFLRRAESTERWAVRQASVAMNRIDLARNRLDDYEEMIFQQKPKMLWKVTGNKAAIRKVLATFGKKIR